MPNNQFGISDQSWQDILEVLHSFPKIKSALIFGSRAKGNFKPGSDIDLALKSDNESDLLSVVGQVSRILNLEKNIPYQVDLLDYNSLANPELKAHIDRVGVEILHFKS